MTLNEVYGFSTDDEQQPQRRRPANAPRKREFGDEITVVTRVGFASVSTGAHEVVLRRPERDPHTDVMNRLLKSARRDTDLDFRTKESLMAELLLSEEEFTSAMDGLLASGKMRRAVSTSPSYRDWYRPTDRGLTTRERWNKFRMIAGRA